MILDALRNQDKAKLEFKELEKLYLLQNLDSLYSFIQKDNSLPNSRLFLEERNIRWISLMKNMMSKQKEDLILAPLDTLPISCFSNF